ncbi:hypothetical protein LTR94_029532, partial [Friedmanniomyces endolithicus]
GGLACAVTSDEGGAAAGFDGEVDAVEQGALSVLEADVFKSDKRGSGGHERPYSGATSASPRSLAADVLANPDERPRPSASNLVRNETGLIRYRLAGM